MERVFDHILIIMFENEYRSYVMANPYMRWLASRGIDMANFHGVTHPSQPNYIASVAGRLCGVTNDDNPRGENSHATLGASCIVDLMESASSEILWKAYMEDYAGTLEWFSTPPYYTKHNPFYMFDSMHDDPDRADRIVDAGQLLIDVENGQMPNYAWLTPNIWNDGHYLRGTKASPNIRHLLVNQVADWLQNELFGPTGLDFPGPGSKLPPKTLVVVTFDEADYEARPGGNFYEGPNQVYTVLLGDLDAIVPGTVVREGYNHYSLLRTVEDNFGLESLATNDAAAGALRFLWGESFSWSNPSNLAPPEVEQDGEYKPIATTSGIALGTYANRAHLISQGNGTDEQTYWTSFDGDVWTAPELINGARITGPMAVAGTSAALVLVYFHGPTLVYRTYIEAIGQGKWSQHEAVGDANAIVGPLALAAFADADSGDEKLMLVFHTSTGLSSMTYDGSWSDPVEIAAVNASEVRRSASLALAELGNLLLLVYEGADGKLTGLTYSLADYNTVRQGVIPSSPRIWSANPARLTYLPGTPELPAPINFQTTGPLAMAGLDGGLYLSWAKAERAPRHDPYGQFCPTDWVHWSCYSMAGVLTSDQPQPPQEGNGTLNEASWGPRHRLTGAPLRARGCTVIPASYVAQKMAMTRLGEQLLLVFGPADSPPSGPPSNSLYMARGSFCPSF